MHDLSESLFEMFDRNKDNCLDWQELEAGKASTTSGSVSYNMVLVIGMTLIVGGSAFEKLEAVPAYPGLVAPLPHCARCLTCLTQIAMGLSVHQNFAGCSLQWLQLR